MCTGKKSTRNLNNHSIVKGQVSPCVQNDSVKNAVERLLASDGEDVHLWILHRSFTMDENSFIESFTLTLLDCVYDH